MRICSNKCRWAPPTTSANNEPLILHHVWWAVPTLQMPDSFSLNIYSKREPLTPLRRRYFCCLSGAVGENLFELAVMQIPLVGKSEFSRRPIGSKNSGDKKPNKKRRGGFAFFGYFFGEAKK
jgi:hypothetical protein